MHKKGENTHSSLAKLNIQLQNKNIELLNAMHTLTTRIDHLIKIFEEAAKNVGNIDEDSRIKELTQKLEVLLEQNKNLANGLVLLEKYVRSKALETPFKRI